MKDYNSTTATITAENGNEIAADIMEDGAKYAVQIRALIEGMTSAYWSHHEKVRQAEFKNQDDQVDAAAKLGQLALALKALKQAHSATNAVRCFN